MSIESTESGGATLSPPPRSPLRRIAVSTAIFALATALSRVAGLGREVVQAGYFGTGVPADAFTVASQIPNLVSNLFSMAALSAAFVPVFTELLHENRRREAFRLASTLFWLILIVLSVLTIVWMAAAGAIMPLLSGKLHPSGVALAAGLSRVLFPVVLLLSLTGLFVGILQSYDRFGVAAAAPAVWNVVIVVGLVALHSQFHGSQGVYAYAIAWLLATVVQFVMIAVALKGLEFRLSFSLDWRSPRVREVMVLFLPVTVSIGIINIDSFLNATLGTLVSQHASIAINDAFRLYMLPQGVFSVAVTTVLFPTLTRMAIRRDVDGMRHALGTGVRQIYLLLIPCAAVMAVLATPIVRLVYQRGAFTTTSTHLVSVALLWFAVSLPFSGVNLLYTRTFFALRRPWIPTKLAAMNVAVDVAVSLALYKPLGLSGLIIGTLVANVFMTWLQSRRLRIGFNGRIEGPQTAMITVRVLVATAITTAVAYYLWYGLHLLVGESLIAQIVSIGIALAAAAALYARLVLWMRIPEARQIEELVRSRLPGR